MMQRFACLDRFGHLGNTGPRARLCVVCAAANSADAPECAMLTDRAMFVVGSFRTRRGLSDYGQRVRDRVREALAEIDRWDNPPPDPPRKKRFNLGTFKTLEEAATAFESAQAKLFGEETT